MAISEQFKLLNLTQKKMRKLCTHEVGGAKMKKNEKNLFCNSKKCIFFIAIFDCSFGFAFQG
jgi:hypothetical protein